MSIQYNKTNFSDMVAKRKDGTTEETFMEDVLLFQTIINNLPEYSEENYKEELHEMDFTIPYESQYDFKELYMVYKRLTEYKFRIIEIWSVVNAHHDLYEQAYKTLKVSAISLYSSGTAKDKEANAETRVKSFHIGIVITETFLAYLKEIKEAVEFASTNLSRMLREKEALSKLNYSYYKEGLYHEYNTENESENTEKKQKIEVQTRKKFNNF
jgi:hypothetical protein